MALNNTKQALAASLRQLLETKPISKISISDITDGCGVSRMTFYYHFKDIYDLLEWLSEKDMMAAIPSGRRYANWQDMCVALMEAVRTNKSYMLNVYRSLDSVALLRYLTHLSERLVMNNVRDRANSSLIVSDGMKYGVNFSVYGFTGVLITWVRGDMQDDPSNVISEVVAALKKQIGMKDDN